MDEFRGIIRKENRDKKRRKRRNMKVVGRSILTTLIPAIDNGIKKAKARNKKDGS